MSPRTYQWLSRLFFAIAVGCFALGGWLWWADRPPASVLRVDAPVQLGTIAAAVDHAVEVPVTNTGSATIRLAGLDGELC